MTTDHNQITLIGRLTKDPQIKLVNDSLYKSYFTIAVQRNHLNIDNSDVDFIPICFWGKKAEISHKMLHKGSPVFIIGKLQIRFIEKDDHTLPFVEVVADNFTMLSK